MSKPANKLSFPWPKALTKEQALECDNFHKDSLRYHDSYGRLGEILEANLSPDLFFACLGQGWSSCDNIAEFQEVLAARLAKATRKQLNLMMADEELVAWTSLPALTTAYRFGYDNNIRGFSYSLKNPLPNFSPRVRATYNPRTPKSILSRSPFPKNTLCLSLTEKKTKLLSQTGRKLGKLADKKLIEMSGH